MTESAELNGANAPFSAVAVIGLGLIGASLAGALVAKMPGVRVFGVDTDAATCAAATDRGWCDAASGPDDPAFRAFIENDCELVVIATPVAAVDDYLARLSDWGYTGVVTDTISTKGHILAAAAELLPAPARYVPGHPWPAPSRAASPAPAPICSRVRTGSSARRVHRARGLPAPARAGDRPGRPRGVAAPRGARRRRGRGEPRAAHGGLFPMQLASAHADDTGSIMRLMPPAASRTPRASYGQPGKLWCGIARQRLRPEERPGRDGLHPGLVHAALKPATARRSRACSPRPPTPAARCRPPGCPPPRSCSRCASPW